MKKIKKLVAINILIITIVIVSINSKTLAVNNDEQIERVEYSEDYKRWLKLTDEEKEKVIQPKMYDNIHTDSAKKNILSKLRLLGASLNSKFSLMDVIPNNLSIRDQKDTASCWAFAALSSLETNLAMNNYKQVQNTSKVYDYSERHMEYAVSKFFANNQINENGYNREVNSFGNWMLAESYLTNGQGAIPEEEMPFENNSNLINISEIKNKTVSTQVYDTVDLEDYSKNSGADYTSAMNKVKEHIKNYGSVFAAVYSNFNDSNTYNNDTGALYCDNSIMYQMNHGVSIIGWDDNYSIENFSEGKRPTKKGAWIIRNSWGKRMEYSVQELKEELFNEYTSQCIANGWNTAEQIPDSIIAETTGLTIDGDIAYMKVGDNGIMYVSYEDCNISKNLYAVTRATDTVNYENLYQYDYYYPAQIINVPKPSVVLCNIFNKKTTKSEYITQVSLYVSETCTCKVYVNPANSEKTKNSLKSVKLVDGDSKTLEAGYHTLEFLNPIEIKGDNFAVAVELTGTRNDKILVPLESKLEGENVFDCVKTETGKCFLSIPDGQSDWTWEDIGSWGNQTLSNSDNTIKVFTVSDVGNNNPEDPGENNDPEDPNENNDPENPNENNDSENPSENNQDDPLNNKEDTNVQTPINTNFSTAKCLINNIKLYTSTETARNDYFTIDVTIEGITRSMQNDKNEYYYYISTNPNETNISEWIKIEKSQNNSNKLDFTIISDDIKNYERLYNSDNLYIYIKEFSEKGNTSSTKISGAIKLSENKDTKKFINDNEIEMPTTEDENIKDEEDENQNLQIQTNGEKDGTVANKVLPNTGNKKIIIIFIAIIGVSIIIYIRYKNLNKYTK